MLQPEHENSFPTISESQTLKLVGDPLPGTSGLFLSPDNPVLWLGSSKAQISISLKDTGEITVENGGYSNIKLIPVDPEKGDMPGKKLRKDTSAEITVEAVPNTDSSRSLYTVIKTWNPNGREVSYYRINRQPGQSDIFGVEVLGEYIQPESGRIYGYKSAESDAGREISSDEFRERAVDWFRIRAGRSTILSHPIEETIVRKDYAYFNDNDNFFTAHGVNLDEVESLLIENLKPKLSAVDALVLIHPDYIAIEDKHMYERLLAGAIRHCKDIRIPVFAVYFSPGTEGEFVFDKEFFNGVQEVPALSNCDETSFQNQVNFVVRKLNKKAADIRLGFGGMLAQMCVRYWRDEWCSQVKPATRADECVKSEPIGYGEIFPELSVDLSSFNYFPVNPSIINTGI